MGGPVLVEPIFVQESRHMSGLQFLVYLKVGRPWAHMSVLSLS
jgi:hypothetical protein